MKYFVGIDLGTQSMKGILMSPEGVQITSAGASYIPDFPRPNWCEQDVYAWECALRDIIQKLMEKASVKPEEIGMIGFASQNGGVVPIGHDGKPLRKCILWLDRRAEPQCEYIGKHITEDEALHLIGSPVTSTLRAPKIMWLRDNEPQVYEKTKAFLEVGEYMVHFLTGELVSDYAHSAITALYDVENRKWSERMMDITGIEASKLCPIKAATDIAGNLTAKTAEFLGLTTATQAVVGSGDYNASAIGSGFVGTGKILNVMGTSEIIAGACDKPVYDDAKLLKTHLHVDPTLWQLEQAALISGACERWFLDNFARTSFDEMNAEAAKVSAGSEGLIFFPALGGANSPEVNGTARGFFFGMTMSHTLPYLTRALYEGCSYAFRDSIERLNALGMGNGEIIATGGGTRSAIWVQIKADLIGKPIKIVENSDTTALGAAIFAGVAQGNFSNLNEAVNRLIKYGREFEPNLALKAQYDEAYAFYRELYYHNKPMFEKYKKV